MRKITALLLIVVFIALMGGTIAAAPLYRDVPSTHWAYEYISRISDRGLMVGDTEGYFKPNDSIDKFETSKILARMAGYKYTNVSDSERDYYNKAYDKNKTFLSQYSASFAKWNSSADREVAYLLEKEILTVEDLNQFVIKRADGTEALRALSREEAAVFFTRLMGRKNEALNFSDSNYFKDDVSISISSKPYVYYLRSLGIVSGDTNNNFNSNGAVTRAAMAIMCDKVLTILGAGSTPYVDSASDSTDSGFVNKAETISGVIDKYYDSLQALQIISNEGKKNIYKLSSTVSITIDGFLRTASDLQEGMPAVMIIGNNELMDIKAQNIQTVSTNIVPISNTELSVVEGTVSSVSPDTVTNTVSIEIRMLNPTGQITSEIRPYALTANCEISRGAESVGFSNIRVGDIISASVSGNQVHRIKLQEESRKITGAILLAKERVNATNSIVLTIQDTNANIHDFKVTGNSYITRRGLGTVTWSELRIGDSVDVYCEYNEIVEIHASGVKSYVDVWIQEIHLTADSSYIITRNLNNKLDTYSLISGTVDPYSLRIGSKVRLRLDSSEVETVNVLEDAASGAITGHVQSIRDTYIVVRDSSSLNNIEIKYDDNTVFVDSYSGNQIRVRDLELNSRVYIVLSNSDTRYAKTITILT